MATVITNLMSAIPWVGQDIVESKNITELFTVATALSALPTIGTVSLHAKKKTPLHSAAIFFYAIQPLQ